MDIRLHANATTTPKQRAYIQQASRPAAELAVELGVSETTVRRWRGRDAVQDRPHTPHRLATTLTPMQEFVVVELRKLLLLPLDDLLVVAREFVCPALSRSALDRCLRRHGVARLADLLPEAEGKPPLPKTFKDYEPGFVHVDIKYLPRMPDEAEHRYLFAAIDRASRWVYFEIRPDKTAATAAGFLERLHAKAPFVIRTVLTDNGKEFTDRFCATGEREPTGQHAFDQTCAAHGIQHRLIKPRHPQTNGMIERFNGRVAEVLKTTTFASARHLETTLQRYLHLYNQHIPQKNLGHVTPIAKLQEYYRIKPKLFQKKPINHPGPDSYERYVYECCKASTIQKVSAQENLVWSTVNDICQRGARQELQERPLSKVKAVGMDELAIKKGHRDYVTVIVDLERIEIVDILEYREQAKLIGYFKNKGTEWCEGIDVFCSDMWPGFINTARAVFPRATVVVDRFHFFGYLNKAVDGQRKSLRRQFKDREELKRLKWALLKNAENLTPDQTTKRDRAFLLFPELKLIYDHKEMFRAIFNRNLTRKQGEIELKKWMEAAREMNNKYLNTFLYMLNDWKEYVLNYFAHRVTTSVIEGINNSIKTVKRMGYGFRNFVNFKQRVLISFA